MLAQLPPSLSQRTPVVGGAGHAAAPGASAADQLLALLRSARDRRRRRALRCRRDRSGTCAGAEADGERDDRADADERRAKRPAFRDGARHGFLPFAGYFRQPRRVAGGRMIRGARRSPRAPAL